MNFEAFLRDRETNHWPVHGVSVYTDGQLLHRCGDTTGKYPIYSATKSILSCAVGIAWDEGKIDLKRSALDYIPERFTAPMSRAQRDIYRRITLHRLMTMSVVGYPFRPEGESWLRFSLDFPVPDPDEVSFDYSNIPAYLVSVALSEAIGEDAWSFIERRILAPLDIAGVEYGRCPDGYFYGASHMTLSVDDLSRVGLMLAGGGSFQGSRIVSEEYVKLASSILQMNREGGYGYFFWKHKDGFFISGKWGQRCYILPGRVITLLSDAQDGSDEIIASLERWGMI